MNDKAIWYLEGVDLKDILCPTKLGQKMDSFNQMVVSKNDYVYLPEDKSDYIYFIEEGRIKIGSTSEEGKEIIKAILSKGEVFGELALINDCNRRDYAVAIEETKLCCMAAENLKDLIKERGSISMFFMKVMGSKVLEMENRLQSLVFKDSRSRIVEYLASLVKRRGQRVGYEWVVRNFITHQEIANLTATSRQTVTTVLNELRASEIITFNRKRLLVRDLDKLTLEIK